MNRTMPPSRPESNDLSGVFQLAGVIHHVLVQADQAGLRPAEGRFLQPDHIPAAAALIDRHLARIQTQEEKYRSALIAALNRLRQAGNLKAALDKKRGELAERARKSGRTPALDSELIKLAARSEALHGRGKFAVLKRNELEKRLTGLDQRRRKLQRLRKDLETAAEDWGRLKPLLAAWQSECKKLHLEAGRLVAESERRPIEETAALRAELAVNREALNREAGRIESFRPEIPALLEEFRDYEAQVRTASEDLDRETAAPADPPADPRSSPLLVLAGRLEALQRRREDLLSRRDSLAAGLERRLKDLASLQEERRRRLSRFQALSREREEAVKSLRSNLAETAGRIRFRDQQLAQLKTGLPPLIGRPEILEKTWLAGAGRLWRARTSLVQARKVLAGKDGPIPGGEEPLTEARPEILSLAAEAAEWLRRLNHQSAAAETVLRLPRQMHAFRAALVRTGRLKKLEAAYNRRREDLIGLTAEKAKLEEAWRRRRVQMERLVEEKKRLAEAMNRSREELARLAEDNRRLTEVCEDQTQSLARLTENHNQLKEEEQRHRQARADLARTVGELKQVQAQNREKIGRLTEQHQQLVERQLQRREEEAVWLAEKTGLEAALAGGRTELARLAEERTRLGEAEAKLQKDLARLGEERKRLASALNQSRIELKALAEERSSLTLNLNQSRLELTRTAEEKKELATAFELSRAEITRLAVAKARLEEEHDRRLQDVNRLTQERLRLIRDKNLLVKVLDRSRNRLSSLAREKDRLAQDLAAAAVRNKTLAGHLKDQAYPLIQALGLALYQSSIRENFLLKTRSRLTLDLDHLTAAQARLKGDKEKSERAAAELSQALTAAGVTMAAERRTWAGEKARLAADIEGLNGRNKNLLARLEELEAEHREGLGLARRQAIEIQDLKDHLADLYPLLTFFVDNLEAWLKPPVPVAPAGTLPEGSEFLVVIIHFLRQENEDLKYQLLRAREERQALALTNDHLSRGHQAIKAHLEELRPVLAYFWQSWLETTADLADSQLERRVLADELTRLKSEIGERTKAFGLLAERARKAEQGLAETRGLLQRTKAEAAEVRKRGAEFMALLAEARREAQALKAVQARTAGLVDRQTRKIASLDERNQTLGRDNSRLEAEGLAWLREALDRADEAETLSAQLVAVSGRAETAWSALTWLAEKTGEIVTRLQNRVAAQAASLHGLERRLEQRAGRIAELEKAQDRLSLLFWLIAGSGGDDPGVLAALGRYAGEPGFRKAAAMAGARLQHLTLTAAGRVSGPGFQRLAKRAVHRGLYSLLLAGGLVFGWPESASVTTALDSGLVKPGEMKTLLEAPALQVGLVADQVYSPYVGRPFDLGFLSPQDKAQGFDHVQALIAREMDGQALRLGLEPADFLRLVRGLFPPGQTVSLVRLKDDGHALDLLRGYFPQASAELRNRALGQDLIRGLYRLAASTEPVECRFWDRLYGDYRALRTDPVQSLGMILHNADRGRRVGPRGSKLEFAGRLAPIAELESLGQEGFTRLMTPYFRAHVKAFTSSPAYAYAHRPEEIETYAQRLAQDMYMAGQTFGVPKTLLIAIAHQESYFSNVLGDGSMSASPFQIYNPSKPYIVRAMADRGLKVPRVPEKLQDHLTLATYMAAFHLATLMEKAASNWGKDKAALCDLDRVAQLYNGGDAYPEAVHRKKLRLLGYLERVKSVAGQKKSRPRA
ncbi:MAG: hypothetical protein AB1641_19230 [Thermodesulfobacteriota bacterium]